MSTSAWSEGKSDEFLDIVLEDDPRKVPVQKTKDQLAMRILDEWELQYARAREHQSDD